MSIIFGKLGWHTGQKWIPSYYATPDTKQPSGALLAANSELLAIEDPLHFVSSDQLEVRSA